MKMKLVALSISAALSMPISVARADTSEMRNPFVTETPGTEANQLQTVRSREFGTPVNVMQIPAAAFHPEHTVGADWDYQANMYWGPNPSNTGAYAWAPLFLPSGARIVYLDLYYNDTSASDMTVYLRKTSGENTTPMSPTYSSITSVSSTGTAGYGYAINAFLGISHTVNNNARYSADGGRYILEAHFPAFTGLSFSGVDVWWYRQISPAPTTATFTDVPTTVSYFQNVEALAASGITAGCGATTYCPTAPVTRAQMAIYLSKALGLHWDH
jgi:hypothetical protein